MAMVTPALIAAMFTGFRSEFEKAKNAAPSDWNKVATPVPSTTASNTYGWLGKFPKLREWIGPRVIKSMQAHGYSITNKRYEATVGVERTDIEDDALGVYAPLFAEMGHSAATHPDELVFSLLAQGRNSLCYDGQNFFDTDHPVFPEADGTGTATTVANLIKPASGPDKTPWYLLDVSRPLKPLIFQERTKPDLMAITDAKDETVFMQDQYLYGVRYRCNAGWGFWQQGVCCTDDLNAATFEKALTTLQGFQADGGKPLGLGRGGKAGLLLVVGSTLNAAALDVVNTQMLPNGGSNKWFDAATILNSPWV